MRVAISRMRSVMLMFVRLYSTMNASAAAAVTSTTTIMFTLDIMSRYASIVSSLYATVFTPPAARRSFENCTRKSGSDVVTASTVR